MPECVNNVSGGSSYFLEAFAIHVYLALLYLKCLLGRLAFCFSKDPRSPCQGSLTAIVSSVTR